MSKLKKIIAFLDGFRKLTIMGIVVLASIALLLAGYITGEIFAKILVGTIPAYMAANVGEHVTNRVKDLIEMLKRKK